MRKYTEYAQWKRWIAVLLAILTLSALLPMGGIAAYGTETEPADSQSESAELPAVEERETSPADEEETPDEQTENVGEEPETPDDPVSTVLPVDAEQSPAPEVEEEGQRHAPAKTEGAGPARAYGVTRFYAEAFQGGKDEGGKYVWNAVTATQGHRFSFHVVYALSGEGELSVGAVEMRVPRHILRDRDGAFADYAELSVPAQSELTDEDDENEFAYYVDKNTDEFVFYNCVPLTAPIGYIEISYLTSKKTFFYQDNGASDPFYAHLTVHTDGNEMTANSAEIPVYINTSVAVQSTEKRFPSIFFEWQKEWGAAPADADQYDYLVWEIRSNLDSNITQAYDFKLEDAVSGDHDNVEPFLYKLQGGAWSTSNEIRNQTVGGIRYDYVLTRHKKSVYEPLDRYTIDNTVTAVCTPADGVDAKTTAVASKSFTWKDPKFNPPYGHFYHWKVGINPHSGYVRYDLDKLKEGKVSYLDGLRYQVYTWGQPYLWAITTGADRYDPASYGTSYMIIETVDDNVCFDEDPDHKMTVDDFEFQYIDIDITNWDVRFDENSQEFVKNGVAYMPNETMTFYGKFNDSDEWVEIASYNYVTETLNFDETYVKSATRQQIVFQPGCVAWKCVTANRHYDHLMYIYPCIKLKGSDYVLSYCEDRDDIYLCNGSAGTLKYSDGEEVVTFCGGGMDRLRGTQRDSAISKYVTATGSQSRKKLFTVTWCVDAQESYTVGTGSREMIAQSSGTFYDLLPKGCTLDEDSVAVMTEWGYLDESEFTIRQTPNFRGSGRTLLTVDIVAGGNYYQLYYNTIHTWDSIKDFGSEVLNPVAYETGNEDIAGGNPDDGGGLSVGNKALFAGLDPDSDALRFIYTEQPHWVEGITAALTQLSKKVLGSDKSTYSDSAMTEPGETYSYRIRKMSSYGTKTTEMIFFDSLENYSDEEVSSDWRGALQSIDVSQPVQEGIAPVIYYSTVSDLSIEEHHDLEEATVWVRAEDYTGELANVKAFAVDLRTGEDGKPFTLEEGKSVVMTVYMTAPDTVPDKQGELPCAYNNVYLDATITGDGEESASALVHQDYTSIALHAVGNLTIHKVNADAPSENIRGIQFRLYGTSGYGTAVDRILTTNTLGRVTFRNLEMGSYKLLEYGDAPNWQMDHSEHEVVVTSSGRVSVDGVDSTDRMWTVENAPRIHGDLTFTKMTRGTTEEEQALLTLIDGTEAGDTLTYHGTEYTLIRKNGRTAVLNTDPTDENTETRLTVSRKVKTSATISGAVFMLTGVSDYGNEVKRYATSDEEGIVTFANLEQGSYDMVELQPNSEYVPLTNVTFTVTVDSRGNVGITGGDAYHERTDIGKERIFNESRYWDIQLRKIDAENPSIWLEGAEFRLTGISDLGTEFDLTASSDENGIAKFTRLEKGSYVLRETKAPTGVDENGKLGGNRNYIPDANQYIVTLDGEGNFDIRRLTQDEYGEFVLSNSRALDGKITVVKRWVDTDASNRPVPVLHLTTEEPSIRHGVAVTVNWQDDTTAIRPTDVQLYLLSRPKGSDEAYTLVETSAAANWEKSGDTWVYEFTAQPEYGVEYAYYAEPITARTSNGSYTSRVPTESEPWLILGSAAEITVRYETLPEVKYAVTIYGIEHDKDSAGHTLGLTFGPAVGRNYVEAGAYKSHTPTGTTASGNAHRCVHDDDWETIIYWASEDPYVYEQCLRNEDGTGESCTKTVPLTLNSTLRGTNVPTATSGDGGSTLGGGTPENTSTGAILKMDATRLSGLSNNSNSGGWRASNIRAVLNGVDETYTNAGVWARSNNVTEANCLLSCFPRVLREAIPSRVTAAGANGTLVSTADKLFLFTDDEVDGWHDVNRPDHWYTVMNEGTPYVTRKSSEQSTRVAYVATANGGVAYDWWFATMSTYYWNHATYMPSDGSRGHWMANLPKGVSPGFCLGVR